MHTAEPNGPRPFIGGEGYWISADVEDLTEQVSTQVLMTCDDIPPWTLKVV